MSSAAQIAYTESIDMVESHQVTLGTDEQYWFIQRLCEVLAAKRDALHAHTDYDDDLL